MLLGILSDTHGYFDPRLPEFFAGVDHILHAGDICDGRILVELERIAPVTAVLGNNDYDSTLRETELFVAGEVRILLRHIVPAGPPDPALRAELDQHQARGVVFGHTHRPFDREYGGVRFLNPGFAGNPRLGHDRGVLVLDVSQRPWRAVRKAL